MQTTYTATFSNGATISRTNHTGRTYTHAWFAKVEYLGQCKTGFAASRELAERGMRSWLGVFKQSTAVAFAEVVEAKVRS